MSAPLSLHAPGLDEVLEEILERFDDRRHVEHAHEYLRESLHRRLLERGYDADTCRLLEVNLLGSLSGWMDFILEQKAKGTDAVPDFARHLRTAFMAHCRQKTVSPETAVSMAVELATAIMDIAVAYRKHLNLENTDPGAAETEGA